MCTGCACVWVCVLLTGLLKSTQAQLDPRAMRPQSMQQTLLQIAPANELALSLSFTHTLTHMLYPWTLLFAHQRFAKARCVLRFEHFQASSAPPFRPAAPCPLLCISLHGCVCVLVLFYCMLSGAATYRFTIEKYTLAFFRQFSQNCSECISLFLFFLLFGPASFLYIFNVLLPWFGVFGAWHTYLVAHFFQYSTAQAPKMRLYRNCS